MHARPWLTLVWFGDEISDLVIRGISTYPTKISAITVYLKLPVKLR